MEVKLVLTGGKNAGQAIPVAGPKFLIGRADDCQLRPRSDRISRHHAVILVEEGYVAVRDLGSTNGTHVNGERIEGDRELKSGDHLTVGPLEFDVELAVSLGGKKKPKVHSISEAAARTVESAGKSKDDVEITDWLRGEEENGPTLAYDTKRIREAIAAKAKAAEQRRKEAEARGEQKAKGLIGRFTEEKKPTSDSSRDAAADMLKNFYNRK